MKKKLLLLALAATLTIGIFTASQASAADIDVAQGESIQDAIDAANPGDVISVAAGTYAGPITINKPLTLRGAQAGVDARDRSGGETIITSDYAGGFVVASAGVTIDGFTIDGVAAGVYGRAIVLSAGADVSNLAVKNNIVINNQTGVVTAGADVTVNNLSITRNQFADNNTQSTAASIFVANANGSSITVADNSFANTDDGAPQSTNALSISGTPASPLSNVVVSGNKSVNDGAFAYVYNATKVTIDSNSSSNQAGNGVLIGANSAEVTITNNTFTDSNNGVRIGGTGSSDITISGNTISGMATAGVMISEGSVEGDVVVSENSLTNNAIGILNESVVAVDANLNWWGCEAGPGAQGCDTIEGIVLASEWYVDDAMTTTNLDEEDEATVPGVPNTGQVTALSGYIAAVSAAVLIAVTAIVVYRRRSTNL